jgi:hypothetical protein
MFWGTTFGYLISLPWMNWWVFRMRRAGFPRDERLNAFQRIARRRFFHDGSIVAVRPMNEKVQTPKQRVNTPILHCGGIGRTLESGTNLDS